MLESLTLIDPHLSQQHLGLLYRYSLLSVRGVTRPNARFIPALPKKSEVDGRTISITYLPISVTRFGDLLDFGQLIKAFGNN